MRTLTFFFFIQLFIFSNSIFAQYGAPIRISNNTEIIERPTQLFTGDMDNDGDIDLISNEPGEGNLVWFENLDGNGSMDDPKIINSTDIPSITRFNVFDIDNDGTLDIIASDNDNVFWYQNTITSTATFSEEIYLPNQELTVISEFHFQDMDGDNILDIIMLGNPLEIGWMKGLDNQGNFASYDILSLEGRYYVRISDFDGDGDLDMVSPDYYLGDWSLGWVSNTDGNGDFGSSNFSIDPLTERPEDLQIADLDGDGDDDVILGAKTGYNNAFYFYWYENQLNQGGTWIKKTISDTTRLAPPTIYDIDTDGDLDIVTSSGGSGGLIVFENSNGAGDFIQHTSMNIYGGFDMHNVDINNDGIQDIVSYYTTSTTVEELGLIYIGRDDQTFENPIDFLGDADDSNTNGILEARDMNGDGIKDLIASHTYMQRVDWQSFDNTNLKFTNPRIIGDGNCKGIDFADFDGDGDEDIVTLNGVSFETNVLFFEKIDGEINFEVAKVLDTGGSVYKNIQAADIDNDGDIDIFFSAGGFFWLENLDGQASFSPKQQLSTDSFNPAQLVDLDQDGDLDIFGHKVYYPEGFQWLENNDGVFSSTEIFINEAFIQTFLLEDVNGDGWKDIISTDFDNIVSLRKNTGSALSFDDPIILPGLNFGQSNFPQLFLRDGDLDGDNDLYILSNTSPNFVLYYLENIGGQDVFANAQLIYTFQNEPSKISIDDYDGDLDMDIIAHNGDIRSLEFIENFLDKPSISGKVFHDENENGNYDNNENLIYPLSILLEPEALATFSSYLGDFYFAVANGFYDVTCNMSSGFGFTTPSTVQVEVIDDSEIEIFYGINTITEEAGIMVTNSSAPTRCGFEVPFWIDYQNTGTVIGNVVISFEIDSLANFVSATPLPDSIVGNTIYWSHENLPITHSGQINLILQMPGVEFLGEYFTFVSTAEITSLDGNHTDLQSSAYSSQLNCAYDPNDKLVEPNIPENLNYTLFGDTLKYTVRFQNTGNDTAFTVRVEDYLDTNLDYASLQVLGASHPYEVTLDANTGRLMFNFENILLPDSSTNEVESHGYFQYQIRTKDNIGENTYIQNSASIFFDFNPPILTNTVENIFVSQYPFSVEINHPSCDDETDGILSLNSELPIIESVQWSNGETDFSIDSLSEGQYDLTINYIDGTQFDTSFFIVNPLPIEIIPTLEHVSCFGENDGSITIELTGGTPDYFLQWYDGLSGLVNEQLASGTYHLTITDANYCKDTISFTIESPSEISLDINIIPSSNQEMNGAIEILPSGGTPPFTYSWDFDATETSNYVDSLGQGNYSVTITDANNCTVIETATVDQGTSIENLKEDISFMVSPNPNLGKFKVQFDLKNKSDWEIKVFNYLGQNIRSKNSALGGSAREEIDFELDKGYYNIILLVDGKIIKVESVIVL